MAIECGIMCICRASLENKATHNLLLKTPYDRRWIMKYTLSDEIEPPIGDKIEFLPVTHEIERFLLEICCCPNGWRTAVCKLHLFDIRNDRQLIHINQICNRCACESAFHIRWTSMVDLNKSHRCCRPPKYAFNKREGAAAISYTKNGWQWCVQFSSASQVNTNLGECEGHVSPVIEWIKWRRSECKMFLLWQIVSMPNAAVVHDAYDSLESKLWFRSGNTMAVLFVVPSGAVMLATNDDNIKVFQFPHIHPEHHWQP